MEDPVRSPEAAMEDDPIHDEQLSTVEEMLGRHLSAPESEGFLIVGNRFVDRFGTGRFSARHGFADWTG
jgi:hypothetical protein